MMSHVGFTRLAVRLSVIALFLMAPVCHGCGEAGLQSGVFACDTDDQCPPGGFFCDNYFNSYVYLIEVNARPTIHGYWGFCNSVDKVIVKDSAADPKRYAEICSNGKDEDADSLVDCYDPECQTSPTCIKFINEQCPTIDPPCTKRLGFPFTRFGDAPSDETGNCPLGVGYSGTYADGHCLPRCRLYFPTQNSSNIPHDPALFSGSDRHCDEIAQPSATADEWNASLECVHLELIRKSPNNYLQHDVCLPKDRQEVTDCTDCPTGTTCITINYRDRLYLYMNTIDDRLDPIKDHNSTHTDKQTKFCVTKNI